MIDSVLVANRGEIARRIFHTCRALGISCVAVYSDADSGSPHVTEADAAVRLPGNAPAETYLRADLLVDAATRAGADAVHPGYGFLAESADFARAVIDAGLTWIGPPASAIESMGSKVVAKGLMADAGVPVLPQLDPTSVGEADLPVLIKASAGGGGRGMRVVRRLADLDGAVAAARSEAVSAFGDGTVFCEPYLATGRHIEVQVLADTHGTVWTVGERECSIQRRHQKVIEETPSPLVAPAMRASLFDAARKAAEAIDYLGAGTVEFLADGNGRFFFLEMNTRLQVEHPVTECTTGLDLVALQIAIASGSALPPEPPTPRGHAIEARLYAEDPAHDWQPQTGTLHHLTIPSPSPPSFGVHSSRFPDLWTAPSFSSTDVENVTNDRPGTGRVRVRVDSGVVDGSVVGPYYDPMLAKVIAWAPDRADAARLLASTLARTRIHGLVTNRDLLVRTLRHPAFLAGDTDTAFFDRHSLVDPLADIEGEALSALAAALADAAANRESAPILGRLPSGWRNVRSAPQRKRYTSDRTEHEVAYHLGRTGLVAEGHEDVALVDMTPDQVVLEVGGVRRKFEVARYDGLVCVDSALGAVALRPEPRFADPAAQVAAGSLVAPMPGTVTRLAVAAGDRVSTGQPLLWLEAMKMEHTIAAPSGGVVTELPVTAGQQVEVGAVLAVVKEDS